MAGGHLKGDEHRVLRPLLEGGLGRTREQVVLAMALKGLAQQHQIGLGHARLPNRAGQHRRQAGQRRARGDVTGGQGIEPLGQCHQLSVAGCSAAIVAGQTQHDGRVPANLAGLQRQLKAAEQRHGEAGQALLQQARTALAGQRRDAAQQAQRGQVIGRAQPGLRLVQLRLGGSRLARCDLLARLRQMGLADQAARLRMDRVQGQHFFGQANRFFEGAAGQRGVHRLQTQRRIVGKARQGLVQALAQLFELARAAQLAQQLQLRGQMARLKVQAAPEPGYHLARLIVVKTLVRRQPAQHQRRTQVLRCRPDGQLGVVVPILCGGFEVTAQLGHQRDSVFHLARRQPAKGVDMARMAAYIVHQQAPAKAPRQTCGQGALLAQQQLVQRGGRGLRVVGQGQQNRALAFGTALQVQQQLAPRRIEAAQAGQPFVTRQQRHAQDRGQALKSAIGRHPRQRLCGLGTVHPQQRQRLEQRPQVTVGRAKGNLLQRLAQRWAVIGTSLSQRGQGRRAVNPQCRFGRQDGQHRLGRDQHGAGQMLLQQAQLRRRQGRGRSGNDALAGGAGRVQQLQGLKHIAAAQQPAQIGSVEQGHATDLRPRAPQRQRLFEHVFGRQLLGPPGVGRRQASQPLRPALALEQGFEGLDRFFEARRGQRLVCRLGRIAGRGNGRGNCRDLAGFGSMTRHGDSAEIGGS